MAPQFTPEWLELEKQQGGRSVLHGTTDEIIQQFHGLLEALAPTMPGPDPDISRKEQDVDGVRTVIFTPNESVSGGKKLPVCVYIHGGGYIMGSPESEALLADVLAKTTPAVVISVDYRLAPQHKHPAALDDCRKVYTWAWRNADSLGGDQSKFFVAGGSAGGGLALGLVNKIVSQPEYRSHVKGLVALVPISLHPDNVPDEYKPIYNAFTGENSKDVPVIDEAAMRTFYGKSPDFLLAPPLMLPPGFPCAPIYLSRGTNQETDYQKTEAAAADPKDADNFVALATENHKHFPPTYFVACGADPLRDDAIVMEKALSKAGVKTKLDLYKGLPHYFWIFSSIPESQQFAANLIEGVKFVLGN